MLDVSGRFRARLEGATSGNVLLRREQHRRAENVEFALEVARACVAGKLRNGRTVLLRGAREAKHEADQGVLARGADDLAASLRALPAVGNLEALRGVEGDAARKYFARVNHLLRLDLRASFGMDGRNRRPPRDRMNALLSFLYSMQMNDCRSAVEAAGLDAQIGFLHVVRPGRAALALDLMEEFRPFADRLAITLVNRGQVSAEDFHIREGGAVSFKDDARKTVLVAYQERKRDTVTHPLLAQPVMLGVVPLVQARLLARAIRGDAGSYQPFVAR
jgi:CRISPR-associated protein Cas1